MNLGAVGLSLGAVDLDNRVVAEGLAAGSAGDGERAGKRLDRDVVLRTLGGCLEGERGSAGRGGHAGGRRDVVDGGGDLGERGAAAEAELLGSLVAGDLQRGGADGGCSR